MFKIKKISFEAAQNAYDNMAEPEFDEDQYEDNEGNRTELVEQYVTHANAQTFEDLYSWRVDGDPNAWLTKLIGFEEGHWAWQFVADELEALANDVDPSDDEIEADAERGAKAVYALTK